MVKVKNGKPKKAEEEEEVKKKRSSVLVHNSPVAVG